MFATPIKNVRLTSLEELKKFSFNMWDQKAEPKTFAYNNGQFAYADEYGCVNVTPYRGEVRDILKAEGYSQEYFFVPFSNAEERPERYIWLAQIAKEEEWSNTFEKAFAISESKGIKPVDTKGITIRQIRDVSIEMFTDEENHRHYIGMTMQMLLNSTSDNVGTYIIISRDTIMVCDEYGRTFVITIKATINDFVNRLIDAGYTRCATPEQYVRSFPEPLPVADIK